MLWARDANIKLPVYRQGRGATRRIQWRPVAYHTVLKLLQHPIYAGAYVFGRTQQRTQLDGDRARKTQGHQKEQQHWNVLLRDNHIGYITWDEFEEHQRMLLENAHRQVPVASHDSDAVQIGVREIIERRPRNFSVLQAEKTLKLPGIE